MKKKTKEIWMNGKYLETARDEESAKLRVERYKREDEHEIKVEGYTNSLPTYEIR